MSRARINRALHPSPGRSWGRRSACWVIAMSAAFATNPLQAATVWKDITNPTGVPDVYQGNGGHCEAAAWADGVWWFNQRHPGLATTTIANWYANSQTLFTDLVAAIDADGKQVAGVLSYIAEMRPGDFTWANDPAHPGKPRRIDKTWFMQQHRWAGDDDLEAEAKASLGDDHRFAVIGVGWHQSGRDANDENVQVKEGGNVVEKRIAHSLAYAGRDTDAANDVTDLRLAHGWPPDHSAQVNPVDSTYYDQYSVTVATIPAGELPPGYGRRHLRITDHDLLDGPAVELADGVTIDYASVNRVITLRDDRQAFVAKSARPGGGLRRGTVATYIVRHVLENVAEGPIFVFAFELPLLANRSVASTESIQFTAVPATWLCEVWDPNDTPEMTPPAYHDELGSVPRTYQGIICSTESDPLMDGWYLAVELEIDAGAIDTTSETVLFAVADPSRGYYAESLGLRICGMDYTDDDSHPDDCDNCPDYSNEDQADCDDDGVGDVCTLADCPGDPACGDCDDNSVPDGCQLDSDGDSLIDVCDGCPTDPNKSEPGVCGCGVPDTDADQDTVPDCIDQCPGEDDLHDGNADGQPDCLETGPVPTVSGWGVIVSALLLAVLAKYAFRRREVVG